MDADVVSMVTPCCGGCSVDLMDVGGLWPTYVVKRLVDKVSVVGCQLQAYGCVTYDPSLAVRALRSHIYKYTPLEGGIQNLLTNLKPVSITAARCVAWRAIVSDS